MSNDVYCGSCFAAYLYVGGGSREEESRRYPVDDFVEFEKLEYGACVLRSRRYVDTRIEHLRKIYDYELDFDAHPSAQLRATQRAMYRARIEYRVEELEPRLAELQRLFAGTATAAEAEDLLDQVRYVFCAHVQDEDRVRLESASCDTRFLDAVKLGGGSAEPTGA